MGDYGNTAKQSVGTSPFRTASVTPPEIKIPRSNVITKENSRNVSNSNSLTENSENRRLIHINTKPPE